MKKSFLLILVGVLSLFAGFASDNILYSYDYNRYYTKKNDVVISLGYQYKVNNYDFRNVNNYKVFSTKVQSSGFELEVIERKAQYSLYENIDFIKRELTLNETKYNVNTSTIRFGALKDFFFDTKLLPITVSIGGGACGKLDWMTPSQKVYNEYSLSLGLSLKAQASMHLSNLNGRYNVFIIYQPDFFVLSNVETGKITLSKNFRMDQSFTAGIQIKLL